MNLRIATKIFESEGASQRKRDEESYLERLRECLELLEFFLGLLRAVLYSWAPLESDFVLTTVIVRRPLYALGPLYKSRISFH